MGALPIAVETPEFLGEIVALLVGGALVAYVGARIGLVPIVGFLLAGVLIGPNALGIVEDRDLVDAAAEIGVILLLFTIGLELSLERVARLRRLIFGVGGLQVVLTTIAGAAVVLAIGAGVRTAIYTGFLIALSSTAIVLALLSMRGEMGEERGRVGVGVLILQDLAIVPMVLLVPVLGGQGGSVGEVLGALAIAVGLVAAVLIAARRVLPPLLEAVARTCSPEVFLVTVMAIVFATAYLTSLAGLSVSLGAFLAGLLVSESRFGQHALGEILPLQIIFSGVFFVSVGMLLDVGFVVDNIGLVIAAIAVVLAIKLVVTAVSARAFGIALPVAGATALMLAQVGEFSFVLERVGAEEGLMPAGLEDGSQLLIATTVILMAATPPLMSLGRRLTDRTDAATPAPFDPEKGFRGSSAESEVEISDHVILAGYGDGARRIVPALREAELPFVITTLNPGGAREAQSEGLPVLQGDHTKAHLLQRAGIHDARLLVVADDELETTYRVASVARALNPRLDILVRTKDAADVDVLADAGANRVISGDRASADALPAAVLRECERDGPGPSIDTERVLRFEPAGGGCEHTRDAHAIRPRSTGCESCLRMGSDWVHLRACLDCGHVGCCDSSPHRHASEHSSTTGHPMMVSLEPNEDWAWCYVDEERIRGSRSRGADESAAEGS